LIDSERIAMNDRSHFDSLVPAVPFSRRGFLVSSVASGFALAVQPVMAQNVPSCRKDAAEDGWRRMLAFFKRHGVS
jgi:dienelactone hydrolase